MSLFFKNYNKILTKFLKFTIKNLTNQSNFITIVRIFTILKFEASNYLIFSSTNVCKNNRSIPREINHLRSTIYNHRSSLLPLSLAIPSTCITYFANVCCV